MRRRFIVLVPIRWISYALLIAMVFAFALLNLASRAAHAGDVTRTASWYAGHPTARRSMIAACRNDPGHGWNDPDCINAKAGDNRVAIAEIRRQAGLGSSPSDPAYWRGNPNLPMKKAICERAAPADQAAMFCDAVRAAAQ